MKIDRLIGIISVLQQTPKTTAPELAEKFEVSRRTINRDIEDICRAGIPIVTTQGAGGGISIMPGFKLDTTVFTEEELQSILIGLKSLDSVSRTAKSKQLTEKICGALPSADKMTIDLSSFYKDSLAEKIELLKHAIDQQLQVTFHYYYGKGDEDKLIEPRQIVFKWSSWYVFGFCPDRNDFRMYKLNRLWRLRTTDIRFVPGEIPLEKLCFGRHITDDIAIAAVYDGSVKYRLVEEYGPESFTVLPDGRLYAEWGFSSCEDAVEWFLKFGCKVEVLGPVSFRERFISEIENILKQYRET